MTPAFLNIIAARQQKVNLHSLLFSTPKITTVLFLIPKLLFTRREFVVTASTSGTCLLFSSFSTTTRTMENEAISLLDSVYGPVDSPSFPLPMPNDEAGLCKDGVQRRYLWTDAFGVMAYISLAESIEKRKQNQETTDNAVNSNNESADNYIEAANKLVNVVHECLGKPASYEMRKDEKSPTGYVGLRIGKLHEKKITDYGMSYDGQYWHYIDKWLMALARLGRINDGIAIAKSCFPYFFDKQGGGIRWKLSVDATSPKSLERSYPNDDTLNALIVFSMLETARQTSTDNDIDINLINEIEQLQASLIGYRPRVTDDPLGWGLEALYDQFIERNPRKGSLAALASSALHPSHISLPFRLYGAMIGARITGIGDVENIDKLIQLSINHETKAQASGYEEHSSINRVMLAMCLLCPGVLARRPNDPLIHL